MGPIIDAFAEVDLLIYKAPSHISPGMESHQDATVGVIFLKTKISQIIN